MPSITVILPTCDRFATLGRAVTSVLAQTAPDLELLLVDNNRREPVLDARAPRPDWLADRRISFIRAPEARNAAMARNAGLARATGDWISFLDDDDAYRPEKLAMQRALAERTGAPCVLCGAVYHLRGRTRVRHAAKAELRGDELLNTAGYAAPLLFHRRSAVRFDEALFAGEDALYAHALLASFARDVVPVATAPLVDVYQDTPAPERTNLRGEAAWRAARRVWWQYGARFSPPARRLFVIRAAIARAKLRGSPRQVAAWIPALLRAGGGGQLRYALNAWCVSAGWLRGRWVT